MMTVATRTSKPKLGAPASAVAGTRAVGKAKASHTAVVIPHGPAIKLKERAALKDPRFTKVMEKLKKSAARSKQHPPASQKASEAQAAANPPAHEKLAGAQANNVDAMKAAETKKPESTSFLTMLRAEIQKAMPKKTEDGDDFMKGDDKQQLKGAMTGNISQQKQEAAGGIKAASGAAPDTSQVPGKEVTPLTPVPAPVPPPAIGAADAMPAAKTDADVSLEQGKKDADKAMSDAKLTTPQLQKANDPRFSAVLTAKTKVDTQAAALPQKYRGTETQLISQTAGKAVAGEHKGFAAFKGQQGKSGAAVRANQLTAKQKDEARRKEVTDHIESIYSKTKDAVDKKLERLDTEVSDMFDSGSEAAIAQMKDYVETRFDDRYSGIIGHGRWLKDKLWPLPDSVKKWFDQSFEVFQQALDDLVVRIANLVETRLQEAKNEVAKGQNEIAKYVAGLDPDLKAVGQAAEKEMAERFDDLRQGIEDKKTDLAQNLAQRYQEAYDKGTAALKEMRDAHKSLVEKVVDAIKEVVEVLRNFKNRIMAMIKKAAEAIDLIIADPIGFLSNLLDAIKLGISQFRDNIWEHLKEGFLAWLFGTLGEAGIKLPKDFSLGSILLLVLEILGITYTKLRAKAVKLIGSRAVTMVETVGKVLYEMVTVGPEKLWEQAKEFLGNLRETIIEGIKEWAITTIIKAAIMKLASMFNPVGAIIQAILAIYHTVIFFVERINQILDFVQAILDSVLDIAKGNISSAANWIEKALARAIPIIISFLAALLGLGGISGKIKEIVKKLQTAVEKAMDLVIAKIVAGYKKVAGWVTGKEKEKEKEAATDGDVRARARMALAEQLKANHTEEEARSIIRQVLDRLRPEGLKSLELGTEDDEGRLAIIAEASPKLPLAHLVKDGPKKPRGRSVTTVVQLTLRVPEDHPATTLEPVAEEHKRSVTSGGGVWTPSTKSSTKLNIVTWNTADITTSSNDSHAEHQFVHWLTQERPDLMENIESIMINNIRRSPCSICGPELAKLLRQVKKARKGEEVKASMYWLVLHSSPATPTSWQTLDTMESAGWRLYAPGTAMPPEGNPKEVRVHLL